MIEVLPLYAILFVFLYRFRCIIKVMTDVNDFFDVVDTPKEAVDQHSKRQFLMKKIKNGEQISSSKKA